MASARHILLWLALCVLLFAGASAAYGQETDTTRQRLPIPALTPPSADTVQGAPPLRPAPPAPAGGGARLKEAITFSAQDSLVITFVDGEPDLGALFGAAAVTYAEADLSAYQINILFSIDELRATGLPSDTGLVGKPSIRQGGETFTGTALAFNMRTERGRVVNAQTAIEDGFIRAGIAKVREDSTLFIKDGAYTTCACVDDPSYSLRSSKMKIVDKKWIYTGPLQLYLFNIPTPLWLPFGFLPAQEGRRSGPIQPSYGEDEFGFYLRDWGWYFALNDYTDLQLQGGFWTKGSLELKTLFRYNRRYFYTGQLQLNLNRFRNGERDDPDFSIRRTSSFRWNHNQNLSPTARLTSNVNLTSSTYLRAVSQDYDDRVRPTIESSISFNNSWRQAGRSFRINASQRRALATGEVAMTLPSMSFSQSARKPFQHSGRTPGQQERWYERISYSYNFSLNNRFSFVPLPAEVLDAQGDPGAADITWFDALLSADDYRRATGRDVPFAFKASHRIPVNASFAVNRLPLIGTVRMNMTPNFSYTEDWFIRTTRQGFDEESGTLEATSVPDFFALRQFSTGVSANTTIYGIFPVRVGRFAGVRHTLRPTLGFVYRPDFTDAFWGYTRTFVDTLGVEQRYSPVNEIQSGLQQALTFSLGNVFETKRVTADSTGDTQSKVLKLFNLDASSSYNFAADSLRLADIRLSGRTRLFGRVDLNASSTYSPYAVDTLGRRVNDYVFSLQDVRLARLTQFNLTARTQLQSRQQRGASRPATTARAGFNPDPFNPNDLNSAFQPPTQRFNGATVDFAIPWSLSLDVTYSISRPALQTVRRAIINTSFSFGLTPNWQLDVRTGYDIEQGELATTNISAHRDFECWQMSFNWVPFGTFQSWSFDLHVKSGHLRDLLRLRQPKSDVRGRAGVLF